MKKSFQRTWAVMRREVIRLRRDWHTLFMMLAIPVIELFLLAYSATITITHLPLTVFDQSHDVQNRALLNSLTNSGYFDVVKTSSSQAEVIRAIDAGEVKGGLIIPPDFAATLSRGDGKLLLLLDGADSYSLQSAYGAANAILQNDSMDLLVSTLQEKGVGAKGITLPINTLVQTLYNPARDDLVFIIPGVAVMILQMFAIVGIATTIVREREFGIAEQLLSTPTRPMENIVGKMIPYLALTFFETILIHLIGVFWFHVPFTGSILLYLALVILFQVSSLCVGLFISTITATQRQVQMLSSLILLLSFLLTGLVFSRIPMPTWTRIVGDLLPATHFIPIARGIIVKGVGVSALWPDIGALCLFILILLPLLPVLSRKRMD
jgi:ABC-2 type transport system permease protein